MPLFAITGHDVAESSTDRQRSRESHLERLYDLQAQNRLVIAGPLPIAHQATTSQTKPHKDASKVANNAAIDTQLQQKPVEMSGSLIIVEFDSLKAAQDWVNDEPYLKAGVYSHVDIKPFIQVLPTPTNEPNK